MVQIEETLDAYEDLSLPDACREAGRLFDELAAIHLRLSLLYDAQHNDLNEVQPANTSEAFEGSFDETHLEIGDCADRWRDAADALEDEEGAVFFLSGVDERGFDRRLRGPYISSAEPEEWMQGGYGLCTNLRVENVPAKDFRPAGQAT